MQKGKILGLDLGISSVGWCLFEANAEPVSDNQGEVKVFVSEEGEEKVKYHYTPTRIIDLGSFVFSQLEDGKSGKRENVKRREKRGMRRQRRRKARRLEALRNLFLEELKIDFFKDVIDKKIAADKTPFEIKRKGLYEKLTKEELTIALYHYMKWRGFKSNRKSSDKKDKESKKALGAINETKGKLNERYFTEYLLDEFEAKKEAGNNNRIHNEEGGGENKIIYNLAADREMYLAEINKFLDV